MLQTERDLDLLAEQCREAVQGLLARYGWRLLDPETFAQRTLGLVADDTVADAQRAAIHTYCHALYAACSGAEGAERQNLAYTELFRYLYDNARRRYPDHAAEAAQVAIERVFLAFERCHEPGTLLAFAFQQLRDAARAIQRQAQRSPQSLDAPGSNGQEALGTYVADERQPELSMSVIAEELRLRFKEIISGFLRAHPRAAQQIAALQLKYLDGLDDATIGQQLGVSVSNVYVLRSRAIKRLQSDRQWRTLAVELGILADTSEL
ncbi:MAG: sigma-70 family RNA polymerase sigma factor [Chloroflexi bacterium]|nr:sigma-70 family RNA polymerase sigma factor [Chloroflexota bacterium]